MIKKAFELGLVILAGLLLAACSSTKIRAVHDASGLGGSDDRLVAFSIGQSELFPLRSLELMALAHDQDQYSVVRIKNDIDESNPTLALFRVPPGTVRFGALRFYAKESWWETNVLGPEASVALPGVTYLGRIQAHSVQMSRYDDTGESFPAGVNVLLEDFGDEDIPDLYTRFQLPDTVPVSKAIPASWSQAEFVHLIYRPIPGRQKEFEAWVQGPVGPDLPASSPTEAER